ncbi:TetR/AcrR family transcriptional regulator [Devosia sp.]|uniref:TetR/AcrR family transcriptional regulator n=1 Tax=Devosia sp. TaxID=1871048 RepID=UPI003A8D124F
MALPHLASTSEDYREVIIYAAKTVFAEKGYDATALDDVLAAAGVSLDEFQRHFDAKEDLIEALAHSYAMQAAASTRRLLDDPTLDSFAKLSGFFDDMRGQKLSSAAEFRATFAPLLRDENLQLHERTQRAIIEVVRPMLVEIITEGVAERTFDTPDPESAAEVIVYLLSSNRQLIIDLHATRDKETLERLSEKLVTKVAYVSTVIDRILGLPEGSLDLADRATLQMLVCAVNSTADAA